MYDAILAQLRRFARELDSFGYVSCLLKSGGRPFPAYTPPLCQRLRTAVKQLHAAPSTRAVRNCPPSTPWNGFSGMCLIRSPY